MQVVPVLNKSLFSRAASYTVQNGRTGKTSQGKILGAAILLPNS